jgi:hypothetical protein
VDADTCAPVHGHSYAVSGCTSGLNGAGRRGGGTNGVGMSRPGYQHANSCCLVVGYSYDASEIISGSHGGGTHGRGIVYGYVRLSVRFLERGLVRRGPGIWIGSDACGRPNSTFASTGGALPALRCMGERVRNGRAAGYGSSMLRRKEESVARTAVGGGISVVN